MGKKESKPFRLPSLFSLHRGYTVIFAVVVCFLLLGFLPSFFHSGRRVHFTSTYYPFALSVDGRDMYMSPGDVYLKAGRHTATLHIADKTLAVKEFKTRPSLFYSWLFEGKQKVFIEVSDSAIEQAYDDIIAFFLSDASIYSTVFEETATMPIRPIYSHLKTELTPALYEKSLPLVETTLRLISSEALKEDAVKNGLDADDIEIGLPLKGEADAKNINVRSERMVSQKMITESDFDEFLEENAEWNLENLDTLVENDMADYFYLKGNTLSSEKPITNISYEVAKAYATWYSKKHNVIAQLPSYEDFLSLNNSDSSSSVPYEFTSTPFEYAALSDKKRSDLSVFENYGIALPMEIINTNSIKKNGDKITYDMGVMLPYMTAPNVGFRLVTHQKDAQL